MKMSFRFIAIIGVLSAIGLGRAQPGPPSGLPPQAQGAPSLQKKKELLDTFKTQGGGAAAAQARANVDNANPRKADLQVADQLREITFWLANEHSSRAAEAALLAISEGDKAKGKLTPAEEAGLNTDNGRMYETVVGDLPKAKARYQDALRLNSANIEAQKGLARITVVERLIANKAKENDAMRLRKQNERPRT